MLLHPLVSLLVLLIVPSARVRARVRANACAEVLSVVTHVCANKRHLCFCNEAKLLRPDIQFAVMMSGAPRSFYATSFSFRHFIEEPNDFPHVFMFLKTHPRSEFDHLAIKFAMQHATVLVTETGHRSNTTVQTVKRLFPNRSVTPALERLDDLERHEGSGGIADMWFGISMVNKLVNRAAAVRGSEYRLIIKTRPDMVYLSPLLLQDLLDSNGGKQARKIPFPSMEELMADHPNALNETLVELRLVPKQQRLDADAPLAFFTDCCSFGGVSDRIFVAPPSIMDVLAKDHWVEDVLSADSKHIREVWAAAASFFSYEVGHGTEHLLAGWALWNEVPVAKIRSSGPHGFQSAILRPQLVTAYCNHQAIKLSPWTDTHCALGKIVEHEAALSFKDELDVFCRNWNTTLGRTCTPSWEHPAKQLSLLENETEDMYTARRTHSRPNSFDCL